MLTPLYCRWKYLERDWISNTIKNQYRDNEENNSKKDIIDKQNLISVEPKLKVKGFNKENLGIVGLTKRRLTNKTTNNTFTLYTIL